MKISACYIVRDEAAVFARSLESLQALSDEIIVVDTGSVDTTREIAVQHGATVYEFPWQEDFALARNQALTKASGDWIIFLDADEYFTPITRAEFERFLTGQPADVLLVSLQNIEAADGSQLSCFLAPRIFRHRAGLCYEGRIHEQLRDNGELVARLGAVPTNLLQVLHTGYSAAQAVEKAERNLQLLEQELQQSEHPEELYGYLADVYYGLGKLEQAKRFAYQDIAGGRRNVTYASRSYRVLLGCLSGDTRVWAERQKVAEQAVQDFPELPEFHAEYAETLAYSFRYEEAEAEMQHALDLFAHYASPEPMQFSVEACALGKKRIKLWQQMRQKAAALRIVSCIIVKNEEKNLADWLPAAKVYSDEILVADTGSTDRTAAMAKEAGATVYDFTWIDDFSAARNFLLDKVQADWIVVLDADEIFYQPENVRPFLAETEILLPEKEAIFLQIINVDVDRHDVERQRYMNLRIFRCKPELRYKGRIHEGVYANDGRQLVIREERERLSARHTGYSSGCMLDKIRRNLVLLQQDIAEHGEGVEHYRYLASTYYELGDFEKAIHYARLHIASPYEIVCSESEMYAFVVDSLAHLGRLEEMEEALKKSIARFPDLPDFYATYGLYLFREGKQQKAYGLLVRSLQNIGRTNEASRMESIQVSVYAALAKICFDRDEFESAQEWSDKVLAQLSSEEDFRMAYEVMVQIHQGNAAEILAHLEAVRPFDPETVRFLRYRMEQLGDLVMQEQLRQLLPEDEQAADGMPGLYHQALAGEAEDVYDAVLLQLPIAMQELFLAELCFMPQEEGTDEARYTSRLQLLPDGMRHCLERSRGGQTALTLQDWESYKLFLPLVISTADLERIRSYAVLAEDFPVQQRLETARQLLDGFYFSAAQRLYESVSAAELERAEDLRDFGICCYQAGDYVRAQQLLRQAQTMGLADGAMDSYFEWIEDGEKNA